MTAFVIARSLQDDNNNHFLSYVRCNSGDNLKLSLRMQFCNAYKNIRRLIKYFAVYEVKDNLRYHVPTNRVILTQLRLSKPNYTEISQKFLVPYSFCFVFNIG